MQTNERQLEIQVFHGTAQLCKFGRAESGLQIGLQRIKQFERRQILLLQIADKLPQLHAVLF